MAFRVQQYQDASCTVCHKKCFCWTGRRSRTWAYSKISLIIVLFLLIGTNIGNKSPTIPPVLVVSAFTNPSSSCKSSYKSSDFTNTRKSKSQLYVSLSPEEQALERTKQQLKKWQRFSKIRTTSIKNQHSGTSNNNSSEEIERQIQQYLLWPASKIKIELQKLGLPTKGRKPDLAKRLVEYEYQLQHGQHLDNGSNSDIVSTSTSNELKDGSSAATTNTIVTSFCGMKLSKVAGQAIERAQFQQPTPIQKESIPLLCRGEGIILHAETGSGKTLAYLLPITETLWKEQDDNNGKSELYYGMILTPTRELAAQVAGVASVLAPPGSVRLISHPTNLMSDQLYWKEKHGQQTYDPYISTKLMEEEEYHMGRTSPRLFIGSAKSIMHSLYGDGKMPASPTRKPAAQELLSRTRWVVLDEVDRLLLQSTKSSKTMSSSSSSSRPIHEKPAAIVTSAVARRTFGKAQVIAASATVGRTLKRELSRVLGLPPKQWPRVVHGNGRANDDDDDDDERMETMKTQENDSSSKHIGRAVTIPNTVRNYVVAVDTSTVGKLLTNAFFVLKKLNDSKSQNQRILLVLTRGCGIATQNAIGALKHFRCRPEPVSLLDVLQAADGTEQLIEIHRQVSGSSGVGESASSSYFQQKDSTKEEKEDEIEEEKKEPGYLLVTGEDTVRGLHLDGLDTVLVVGRAHGPDEYTHIAGRTGRAGKPGKVINILSQQQAAAVKGWEKMLNVDFEVLDIEDIASTN